MSTVELPKPLPKITIDGQSFEFQPGDTIMKAAERARIDHGIPRFCYHPGLPVAGTCRMCTVEVEKAPKLMTACSTPAADGMIVHTQSDKARKSRGGVLEFLLINHPLDCPVCDKAGECSLQDYNYEYGPGTSEFHEDKRVFTEASTKKLSSELTLNMNRCVHCERCVRFTEDVTKTHELLMNSRGWKKELTTALEAGVFNEYQGNIADICPVGAITFNDFRFKKRVWFLKKKPTVCDGCAKGCAVFADSEHEHIYRYRARQNDAVNGHWICDEGRLSFKQFQQADRIVQPLLKDQASLDLHATNWDTLVPWLLKTLQHAKQTLVLLGTDSSSEEIATLMQALPTFAEGEMSFRSFNGTGEGLQRSAQDAPIDSLLKRRDKTANTKGLELLGLQPFGEDDDRNYDLALYFRCGRTAVPEQRLAKIAVAWGVWQQSELKQNFDAVIPGLSLTEKSGSFTNCDGITQNFEAVVKAPGACSSVRKILEGMKLRVNTPLPLAREVIRDSVR